MFWVLILVSVAVAVAARIRSGIYKDQSEALLKEVKVRVWKGWNPVAKEEISEDRWIPIQAEERRTTPIPPNDNSSSYAGYEPKDAFVEENTKFRDRDGNDLDRLEAYVVSTQIDEMTRLDRHKEWWSTLSNISGSVAVVLVLSFLVASS